MTGQDGLEAFGVENASLDELEEPGFVLGAAHLQGNGREMFGGEDARGNLSHRNDDGVGKSLLDQGAGRRQKLNRPASDDDVFALHAVAARRQIIENGLWTDEHGTGFLPEGDKDVHVECRDGFEVERGSHGTADGVAFDHAIGLHLIDECNYFNNVHGIECQAANWLRET